MGSIRIDGERDGGLEVRILLSKGARMMKGYDRL